jgi:hypothetical protein
MRLIGNVAAMATAIEDRTKRRRFMIVASLLIGGGVAPDAVAPTN